ncbi:MAG: CBS domain-containing protein [Polyangiaceae bacterium]
MSLSRFVRSVVVASEGEPIANVARKMRDARVGSVVVTRSDRPIGIVTDRDLALRVVAEERSATTTRVADVVTYGPFVLQESDEIETAVRGMREHGVRRLPVVDADGKLVGMVSADDLVMLFGRELAALADSVEESTDAYESR